MEYFPDRLTRIWLLNRLYRYAMRIYPVYAALRFGGDHRPLVRLGSDYGGWYVPLDELSPQAIVYSAGIGLDMSFDEALIRHAGCTVYAFDPTPHSVDFIEQRRADKTLPERFHFSPVGLWDEDAQIEFFAPKTRGWVGSYSALNLQGTKEVISVPVRRLSTLMRENGHTRIDLLKMDIEGAEYRVLKEIIEDGIDIRWLCLEFDQPVPFWTTTRMLKRLRQAGFRLCKVDRWNFVFQNHKFISTATA